MKVLAWFAVGILTGAGLFSLATENLYGMLFTILMGVILVFVQGEK